jgi:protease-4
VSKLSDSLRRLRLQLSNRRRARRKLPPYIVISLEGEIVELPPPTPELPIPLPGFLRRYVPLPSGPTSLLGLHRVFERLQLDPRVKGVVLKIDCMTNASIYQSLRAQIQDFRASGKRVVAYADSFGPYQYYLACACDQIIMPPSADWDVRGFANVYLFFKDALDRIGVGVDVVNVSPFKSAGDQFARNDFSAESRAQADWLLDARYNELVRGIAEGRRMGEDQVRQFIDQAPLSAEDAVTYGLLDAALYEDQIEHYLIPEATSTPTTATATTTHRLSRLKRIWPALAKRIRKANPSEPKSKVWIKLGPARKALLEPNIEYGEKYVGIINIEGLIVPGQSRKSPLPIPLFTDDVAGSESVVASIRAAMDDDEIAAVILHVDSQGGSALASDLIAHEVRRLREKKPVVAYLGSVAASGGYYVSALAHHIVAQPLTITGSIGVILIKPHVDEAYGKFDLRRTTLQRGKNASLFDDTPLTADERIVVEDIVARSYTDFKRIVSEGRQLPVESLEPICGGRVWTGMQAYERKLVDALGGFAMALNKARELAKLPADKRTPIHIYRPARKSSLLSLFALTDPATWLRNQWAEAHALFTTTRAWAIALWGTEKSR